MQKRTTIKDYCPGYFEVVAGGVVQASNKPYIDWTRRFRTVSNSIIHSHTHRHTPTRAQAGETYEENAYREVEEELGIKGVPLMHLFTFYFEVC